MSISLVRSLCVKLAVSWTAIAVSPLSGVLCGSAAAQVSVQVQLVVPTIRFETAPVLVEVSPGVQVVQDYDDEVFFVDGWYWYRTGPTWYRTRDHRGGWVVARQDVVPGHLTRIPRGKYKHYRGRGPQVNDQRRPMAPPPGRGPQFDRKEYKHHDDRQDFKEHKEHKEHNQHKGPKHGRR